MVGRCREAEVVIRRLLLFGYSVYVFVLVAVLVFFLYSLYAQFILALSTWKQKYTHSTCGFAIRYENYCVESAEHRVGIV